MNIDYEEILADNNSVSHRRLVCGVGFNDADYIVTKKVGDKRINCPIYQKWCAMLKRCYDEGTQKRQPTYIGCTVCDEWLLFSNFRKWMLERDWKNKHLDKDIIRHGNKVYCPEYCCLINSDVNKLLCDNKTRRGDLPQGVRKNSRGKNYNVKIRINGERKTKGGFETIKEASYYYKKTKFDHIIEVAMEHEDIRVREGLIYRANLLISS